MRLQTAFKLILAAISGAIFGFLSWFAYWNFNVIPDAAWSSIVSLSLAPAIHEISPGLDIPFLIIIRALPLSILLGLIGGALLPRFKYPRVFCYSVFVWPLTYFIFSYYVILSLESTQFQHAQILWRSWHGHQVIAFAVYGWFFIGLYIGSVIAKRRMASRSARPD
jgi:hypothetical protein